MCLHQVLVNRKLGFTLWYPTQFLSLHQVLVSRELGFKLLYITWFMCLHQVLVNRELGFKLLYITRFMGLHQVLVNRELGFKLLYVTRFMGLHQVLVNWQNLQSIVRCLVQDLGFRVFVGRDFLMPRLLICERLFSLWLIDLLIHFNGCLQPCLNQHLHWYHGKKAGSARFSVFWEPPVPFQTRFWEPAWSFSLKICWSSRGPVRVSAVICNYKASSQSASFFNN
jgi:hypothetical protein